MEAERRGDSLQANQPRHLLPRRVHVLQLIQVGAQAQAHPAPQRAVHAPDRRGAGPELRRAGGALAGISLLGVVIEVTCGGRSLL